MYDIKVDLQIKKEITKTLLSSNCVIEVIDISSNCYSKQILTAESDIDLIIILNNKPSSKDIIKLKIMISFILKRFPAHFYHNFIILPEKLLPNFITSDIYKRKIFKNIKNHDIQNLFSQFEWSTYSLLILKKYIEIDNKLNISKFDNNISNNLLQVNKSLSNSNLKLIKTNDHYEKLTSYIKVINNQSSLIMRNIGLTEKRNFILQKDKSWYGTILFSPQWFIKIVNNKHINKIIPKKIRVRILSNNIYYYFHSYRNDMNITKGSIYYSEYVSRRKFINNWDKYLKKNMLHKYSCQPMVHHFWFDNWKKKL